MTTYSVVTQHSGGLVIVSGQEGRFVKISTAEEREIQIPKNQKKIDFFTLSQV